MKEKNAYFTVEACLVLPLVMSATLLGIYLFCFQYDRCLLEQDLGSLALWSSSVAEQKAGDAAEMERLIRQRTAEINQDKYVAWRMSDTEIRLEHNHIIVSGGGGLTFPVPGWNLWNDSSFWKAKTSFQNARRSPVFYIRQYRRMTDLLGGGADTQNE